VEGIAAGLFLIVEVADGVFVGDRSQAVDDAALVKDGLSQARFADAAVPQQYDIANVADICHCLEPP
jgi:hypothetical protein